MPSHGTKRLRVARLKQSGIYCELYPGCNRLRSDLPSRERSIIANSA